MGNLLEYKLDLIAQALGAYVIEDVATVMRRDFAREDGLMVTVIDFYPPWNDAGTFGKHKVAHEYMDQPWQRKRFEKFAGVKIDDLPVYEAGQALKRNKARPHRCEVNVQPFRLMLQPRQDADGNDLKTWILRYLPGRGRNGRPAPGPSPSPKPGVGAPTQAAPPPPPPAGNGRPAPATDATATGADGERNHYQLALAATHPNQFDYHVYKLLEKNELLQDVANITSTREMLVPKWKPNHKTNRNMMLALRTYLERRLAKQADGYSVKDAHAHAKGPAMYAFQHGKEPR